MSTPMDDRQFCGCIVRDYTATCWWCMSGRHDRCTADQHGDSDARCPRNTEAEHY